jgi:hypothetical protein
LVYGHLIGTADGQLCLRGINEYQVDQKAEECDKRQDNKAFRQVITVSPEHMKFYMLNTYVLLLIRLCIAGNIF